MGIISFFNAINSAKNDIYKWTYLVYFGRMWFFASFFATLFSHIFCLSRLSAVSRSKKYKQLVFVFIYLYYNKIRRKVFELSKKAEKRISLLGGRSRAPLRLRLGDSMSADYSGGAGALCFASRSFAGENRHQGSARAWFRGIIWSFLLQVTGAYDCLQGKLLGKR